MARALRVCPTRGCPELTPGGPCAACARDQDRARGRRQTRGYDAAYDAARRRWRPRVQAGTVDCFAPTCLEPVRRIHPGALWDLGHDDARNIRGPEHRRCNRSAGGKASHV